MVTHTKNLKGDEKRIFLDDGILSEASVPIFVANHVLDEVCKEP